MILNREIHYRKNNIKNSNEEEEFEEEEDIEIRDLRKKIRHNKKHKEDYEEEEEEELEEKYNDSNKSQKKGKKSLPKKFIFLIVFGCLLLIIFFILLITRRNNSENNQNGNSIVESPNQNEVKKENKEAKENEEKKENLSEKDIISKEMLNYYNQDGCINIIKYDKEKILKQEYKLDEKVKDMNHIHISTAFTDSNINEYIKHLASILYHADKEKTFIHLHMMDAGEFNYYTFSKLSKMIYNLNNFTEIIVYNANSEIKKFNIKPDKVDQFKVDYAKLYAFKVLKDIKKIIFLNGNNIMVQKDLTELYNLEMNDIYARGISEEPGLINNMDWYDKYIMDKSHYINCGVLLVNLELCQKDTLYEKAIELNNEEFYMKTECPMQDILNVLMRKKLEFFDVKYNKINFYENPADRDDETKWYPYMQQALKSGEKNNHFYSKEKLLEADQDPVIVNYYWDKALNKVIVKYEEEKKNYAKLCGLDE